MDICVLSRPYDDQAELRIRLETDAVLLIVKAVQGGALRLISSPVHFAEIDDISDACERAEIGSFLSSYSELITEPTDRIRKRAEEFVRQGMGIADAAHLAYAEVGADCLVTCDDRFLKRARKLCPNFPVLTVIGYCEKEHLI